MRPFRASIDGGESPRRPYPVRKILQDLLRTRSALTPCSSSTAFAGMEGVRLERSAGSNYNSVAFGDVVVTRVEKLVRQLMACPRTFRFDDAVRVMAWYGFVLDGKGRTSGSRVRFYRESDGRMMLMHVPHPGDELRAAAVREMASFLKEAGRR